MTSFSDLLPQSSLGPAGAPVEETVDICICIHERLTVLQTLESLARQRLPWGIRIRVLVADNNRSALSRAAIEDCAARLRLDLDYFHAPENNIAIARNRCLEEARADWVAFLDDDEVAPPDWLASLLSARDGADAVFGPVQALYPDPDTSPLLLEGDFHSTGMQKTDPPDKGYSGNVLLRRDAVEAAKLRFDPAFGRIGGEDTLFFKTLHRHGAVFRFERRAVLYEEAGPDRANLRWLVRRRFRTGQIYRLVSELSGDGGRWLPARAAAKAGYCLILALLALPRPAPAAAQVLRASFHTGVLAAWAGKAARAEYGRRDPAGSLASGGV